MLDFMEMMPYGNYQQEVLKRLWLFLQVFLSFATTYIQTAPIQRWSIKSPLQILLKLHLHLAKNQLDRTHLNVRISRQSEWKSTKPPIHRLATPRASAMSLSSFARKSWH